MMKKKSARNFFNVAAVRRRTIIKAKCKDTLAKYNYNKELEREERTRTPQNESSVGKRAKSTERTSEHAHRVRERARAGVRAQKTDNLFYFY